MTRAIELQREAAVYTAQLQETVALYAVELAYKTPHLAQCAFGHMADAYELLRETQGEYMAQSRDEEMHSLWREWVEAGGTSFHVSETHALSGFILFAVSAGYVCQVEDDRGGDSGGVRVQCRKGGA